MQIVLEKAEIDVVINHLAVGRYVDVANILNKIATQVQTAALPPPKRPKTPPPAPPTPKA
jgi:hypothetical protein